MIGMLGRFTKVNVLGIGFTVTITGVCPEGVEETKKYFAESQLHLLGSPTGLCLCKMLN